MICLLVSFFYEQITSCLQLSMFFIFQKLEDRFNEKEAQNVQRQAKLKVIGKALICETLYSLLVIYGIIYMFILFFCRRKQKQRLGNLVQASVLEPDLCLNFTGKEKHQRNKQRRYLYDCIIYLSNQIIPKNSQFQINSSLHYCRLKRCTLSL